MTEDGSIVINTKIRTDGIKAGTAEIEAGVHRAADRVNTLGSNVKKTLNNQIDSFVKLNDEYSMQEQKVESLRQKVAAYANQRIPTTEYKEITAQIEQAQEKLNRLNDAKERFGATGGKVNSTSYKKMQYDIDELANTIKYARSELIDLEVSGKAFSTGVNTKEAQADMERLASAERKLADMQNRLNTSYSGIKSKLASYGIDAIGAALLGAFVSSKISPLVLGIKDAITSLIGVFTGAGGLSGAISMIVTAFKGFAVDSNVIPIAIALAVAAIVLIITHWDQLKVVMSKLIDWIKRVFATDWHTQFGVFGDVVEVFLNSFKGIFNSIKQICSGFVTFLKGVFTGNVDMALKGILKILRGAANLIYSIFKAPVNMVIALFNGLNRAIINAINGLVDGLNHIKVPDWVPGIGGKGINLSHANYKRIPYLAQGAVIPAGNPFLAVLGDQRKGNNLELPENLLRKIVSEESGKGTGMIKLVVNLDSRTVLERLINTAKEMQMSNGQNVFELGR